MRITGRKLVGIGKGIGFLVLYGLVAWGLYLLLDLVPWLPFEVKFFIIVVGGGLIVYWLADRIGIDI